MTISKKLKALLSISALAATGLAVQADHAAARSTGAFTGYAVPVSDAGCFLPWDAGVIQTCAGLKDYEIILNVDSSSTKTVRLISTDNGVTCTLFSRRRTGGLFNSVPFTGGSLGTGFFLQTAKLSVPAENDGSLGFLSVKCTMAQNSRVQSINW